MCLSCHIYRVKYDMNMFPESQQVTVVYFFVLNPFSFGTVHNAVKCLDILKFYTLQRQNSVILESGQGLKLTCNLAYK